MSLGRRLELLGWAMENDIWIFGDDYDGKFSPRTDTLFGSMADGHFTRHLRRMKNCVASVTPYCQKRQERRIDVLWQSETQPRLPDGFRHF
jgi:DNA-binding transcriptional MocR family regulator